MRKFVFKAEAIDDIGDSYEFYESRKENLGEEFLNELESTLKFIREKPSSFPKILNDQRKVSLKRFPFIIVFEIEKKDIVIYAVYHGSRDPLKKFQKEIIVSSVLHQHKQLPLFVLNSKLSSLSSPRNKTVAVIFSNE